MVTKLNYKQKMGCGLSNEHLNETLIRRHTLGITSIINIELDKWNYRQINIAKNRFISGLYDDFIVLNFTGFLKVFPELRRLPNVIQTNNIGIKKKCIQDI